MISNALIALRRLWKAPIFTLVAVTCLALGIGANTAVFGVINTVLLRPLPFFDVSRIVFIGDLYRGPGASGQRVGVTPVTLDALAQENQVFTHVGAVMGSDFAVSGGGDRPEYVQGARVTNGWLRAMGLEPQYGRLFSDEEDQPGQAGSVVVIGYGLWQRRFAGQPALGKEILLNDRSHTVVGILPDKVQYPYQSELWVPMGVDSHGPERLEHMLGVFGQLKPGVTLPQVRQDLDRMYRNLGEQYPDSHKNWGYELKVLRDELLRGVEARLFLLLAAVSFLTLIACANVANMMLARAQDRQGELALRLALGSPRRNILRLLLGESVVLALLGGFVGLFLVRFSLSSMVVLSPLEDMNAFYQDLSIDWRVFLFTLGISVLVGVIFGLAPSLRSIKTDLQTTLRSGSQRGGGDPKERALLSTLVVVETALAVMLLIGAGVMIHSLRELQSQDVGFDTSDTLTLRLNVPSTRYDSHEEKLVVLDRILQDVRALPGVVEASAGGSLPLAALLSDRWVAAGTVADRPVSSPSDFLIFNHRLVGDNYLQTLKVPLIEGRYFSTEDHAESAPVVIVSRYTAEQYWPGKSAVGQRIKRGRADSDRPWMTVVGVVEDVADRGLGVEASEVGSVWYLPYQQHDFRRIALTVRTTVQPQSLVQAIQEIANRHDPDMPLYGAATMADRLADSFRAEKFVAYLLTGFGLLGLLLAIIGIYGVLSYAVSRQKRDIGIRMALGADSGDVHRLVVLHGLKLACLGLAIGLVGASMLTSLLAKLYPSVGSDQPLTSYLLVIVLLPAVAFLACWIPARRASKVDPIVILRQT